MNDQQHQAVEKAADERFLKSEKANEMIGLANRHSKTVRMGFDFGASAVIQNPSDFGLVSKEEMFEFAEYTSNYDWHFDGEFWYRNYGLTEDNVKTTSELFEIYTKTKTEQK